MGIINVRHCILRVLWNQNMRLFILAAFNNDFHQHIMLYSVDFWNDYGLWIWKDVAHLSSYLFVWRDWGKPYKISASI